MQIPPILRECDVIIIKRGRYRVISLQKESIQGINVDDKKDVILIYPDEIVDFIKIFYATSMKKSYSLMESFLDGVKVTDINGEKWSFRDLPPGTKVCIFNRDLSSCIAFPMALKG